jgi:hypothetical protein
MLRAPVQFRRDVHDGRAGSGFGGQRLRVGFAVRKHVAGQVVDEVAD